MELSSIYGYHLMQNPNRNAKSIDINYVTHAVWSLPQMRKHVRHSRFYLQDQMFISLTKKQTKYILWFAYNLLLWQNNPADINEVRLNITARAGFDKTASTFSYLSCEFIDLYLIFVEIFVVCFKSLCTCLLTLPNVSFRNQITNKIVLFSATICGIYVSSFRFILPTR